MLLTDDGINGSIRRNVLRAFRDDGDPYFGSGILHVLAKRESILDSGFGWDEHERELVEADSVTSLADGSEFYLVAFGLQ